MDNGQQRKGTEAYQEYPGGPLKVGNPGRPPDTEETKLKNLQKKAIKELVAEYKERLAAALPEIDPVLAAKAKGGDIAAIKEINDILVEKAVSRHDVTSGDKPIPFMSLNELRSNDGDKQNS